jgi:hypothetical protein
MHKECLSFITAWCRYGADDMHALEIMDFLDNLTTTYGIRWTLYHHMYALDSLGLGSFSAGSGFESQVDH